MIFSDESRGEYMIMASMQNKQTLSDMVFDVKEKLSDEEYKNIMEKIGEQKTYIKIRYMLIKGSVQFDPEDCGASAQIRQTKFRAICELLKKSNPHPIFDNIHKNCVVEPRVYEMWKEHKDDKAFWPQTFHNGSDEIILVFEFEEL